MADLLEHYPQLLETLKSLHKDRNKRSRWGTANMYGGVSCVLRVSCMCHACLA